MAVVRGVVGVVRGFARMSRLGVYVAGQHLKDGEIKYTEALDRGEHCTGHILNLVWVGLVWGWAGMGVG